MVANLITTLMLALGVASGSYQSETCNAFKHEKPIQRATEQVTLCNISNPMVYRSQYITEYQNTGFDQWSAKNYLQNDNVEDYNKPHYYNSYLDIYNTIYEYNRGKSGTTTNSDAKTTMVFSINNYTATSLVNVELNFTLAIWTTYGPDLDGQTTITTTKRVDENNNYEKYIDRTITTSTTAQQIYTEAYNDTNGTKETTQKHPTRQNNDWQINGGNYEYNTNVNISIPRIEAHSNINIIILIEVENNKTGSNNLTDYMITLNYPENHFIITGYQEQVIINQEIVDIPELMFTILTLPFTFYSTAFNLTIFPGTPYALNFGNLILTIVAALVLLYLIKKVLR